MVDVVSVFSVCNTGSCGWRAFTEFRSENGVITEGASTGESISCLIYEIIV